MSVILLTEVLQYVIILLTLLNCYVCYTVHNTLLFHTIHPKLQVLSFSTHQKHMTQLHVYVTYNNCVLCTSFFFVCVYVCVCVCVCVCVREREREIQVGGGQANQHHWLYMPTFNLESTVVAMQMCYYCKLLSNNILCEATVTWASICIKLSTIESN